MMYFDGMSDAESSVLNCFNIAFVCVFLVELIIKIAAQQAAFFKKKWN